MTEREVTGLSAVPIGRAVDGVRIRLLDSLGQPARPGEAAEICLAGAGLARGYLRMPGLTAGSFVPDPGGPAGSRMYRTGDLAMLRADGELEFLGRIDRQLKVGGFRIEPVEVEEALIQFPGVRQAAVVESPRAISTALAAFVTGADVNIADVRDFLRSKLPGYMVPAEIRAVSELPTTANGKIDHGGLTRMLSAASTGPKAGDQPCSAAERVVARLWCDTLGREKVSRTDSFLDLGGSLDVMRIAVHLSRLFKMKVPLLWVYEAPTVASLARLLESAKADVPAIAESCLAAYNTANENSADSTGESWRDERA